MIACVSIGETNLLGYPVEIRLTYHEDRLSLGRHLVAGCDVTHCEGLPAGHCHHEIVGAFACPLPGHGPSHLMPIHSVVIVGENGTDATASNDLDAVGLIAA